MREILEPEGLVVIEAADGPACLAAAETARPDLLLLDIAMPGLSGWAVAKRKTVLTIAAGAIASSILFFAVTNFGVWLVMDYYPKTAAGLAACYVAAIPFFQNTLASDLFYAGLLFGGFALAERSFPMLRERRLAHA